MNGTALAVPVRAIARGDIVAHGGVHKAVDTAATIGESTILELHDGSVHVLPADDRKWVIR